MALQDMQLRERISFFVTLTVLPFGLFFPPEFSSLIFAGGMLVVAILCSFKNVVVKISAVVFMLIFLENGGWLDLESWARERWEQSPNHLGPPKIERPANPPSPRPTYRSGVFLFIRFKVLGDRCQRIATI